MKNKEENVPLLNSYILKPQTIRNICQMLFWDQRREDAGVYTVLKIGMDTDFSGGQAYRN